MQDHFITPAPLCSTSQSLIQNLTTDIYCIISPVFNNIAVVGITKPIYAPDRVPSSAVFLLDGKILSARCIKLYQHAFWSFTIAQSIPHSGVFRSSTPVERHMQKSKRPAAGTTDNVNDGNVLSVPILQQLSNKPIIFVHMWLMHLIQMEYPSLVLE